jgi:hypothetical protein
MSEVTSPNAPATGVAEAAPNSAAGVFVGAVWLLMTVAALGFVYWFGCNVPFYDEWDLLPGLTGEQPIGEFVWARQNEHSLPLPRFVFAELYKLTHSDLRPVMYLTVSLHALVALLLIATARRVRGHFSFADACFPILLLNWGQFENFLMADQIGFAISVGLVTLFLRTILLVGPELSWPTVLQGGLLLGLLPFCGGHALIYVPVFGLWLFAAAVRAWLSHQLDQRTRAAVLTALVTASVGYFAWVAAHTPTPVERPANPGIAGTLKVTVEFMSMAWGWAGELCWPFSGVAAVGVVAIGAALLLAAWGNLNYRDPLRIGGLFLFLIGGVLLAGAVGYSRAGYGPLAGFASRYVTIAVPVCCAAYFAATLYGGKTLGSLLPMGLFAVTCLLLVPNMRSGVYEGQYLKQRMVAFTADVDDGLPIDVLASRYTNLLHPSTEWLEQGLNTLRRNRVGAYAKLAPRPESQTEALAVQPTPTGHAAWNRDTGFGTNADSTLVYELPRDRFVYAVRVTGAYLDRTKLGRARFTLRWKSADGAAHEQAVIIPVTPGMADRSTTVWVNGTIGKFELSADDQPWAYRVKEVELVTPTVEPETVARMVTNPQPRFAGR